MRRDDRSRPTHHTGDPAPPDAEPEEPHPTWGDEGGGGDEDEEDQRPKR